MFHLFQKLKFLHVLPFTFSFFLFQTSSKRPIILSNSFFDSAKSTASYLHNYCGNFHFSWPWFSSTPLSPHLTLIIYSAPSLKILNNQDDITQPWPSPTFILNQSLVPSLTHISSIIKTLGNVKLKCRYWPKNKKRKKANVFRKYLL